LQPVEVVRVWLEGALDPHPRRGWVRPVQVGGPAVERLAPVLLLVGPLRQADVGLLRHPALRQRAHRRWPPFALRAATSWPSPARRPAASGAPCTCAPGCAPSG